MQDGPAVHPWLLQKCTVFHLCLLYTQPTPINLATPIYCVSNATPNFLAAPQSTLVFFGTKAKPFLQSQFYLSHLFSLSCPNPVFCETKAKPFSQNICFFATPHTTFKLEQLMMTDTFQQEVPLSLPTSVTMWSIWELIAAMRIAL
jgi:hypothetical protein